MAKTTNKAKNASPKRRRGRAPGPYTVNELRDNGDSVLHMSKHVRVLLGTALGAALGAAVGQIFAENPDEVIADMTQSYETYKRTGKFTYKGQPIDVETVKKPTNEWLKDEPKTAVMWQHGPTGSAHAFPMVFDGPVQLSACGDFWSTAVPHCTPGATKCFDCMLALKRAGYREDDINPVPKTASSAPGKTSQKRRTRA
jgi:hypothetical protein